MNKKSLRDLGILVVICLVAALALAITNQLTVGPIAENKVLAEKQTRVEMLSTAATFEAVELSESSGMDSCFMGLDADGNNVGYVIQTTVNGYAGDVVVTLGLDMESNIIGVNVGGENFSETPGLGALAKEPAFTDQYIGKHAPLTLIKPGAPQADNTIDSIAGATRTSAAVNGGINLAGKYIADLAGGGSPNTASSQGFAGPVAVSIELDDSNAISDIVIGDDYFNETAGYGLAALDESFYGQFIGMTPPLELSDIDAIAGATVTSKAVVNAVNLAFGQLTGAEAPVEEGTKAEFYEDGAWRAAADGFAGPVAVKLELDDALTIQSIVIGDNRFAETEYFGEKALEADFQDQFIGKILPVTVDDIDGIAGATITTDAVLESIDAIYKYASDDEEDEPQPIAVATLATEEVDDSATLGDDGAWRAASKGFAGPVAVKLEMDDNYTITSFEVGDNRFAETEYFGEKALEADFQSQFVGKALPVASSDIDGIAGATITTDAVLSAVDMIYMAANPDAEVAEPEATVDPDAAALGDDGAWRAASKGFQSPVAVKLVLDGLTISEIEIGDNRFDETEYLGDKVLKPDFQSQFVGKTLPIALEDIDAYSGATITTKALVASMDKIYEAVK
ncbi:MAG: FMN-binding protein [Clostridiales bacterium]|nr:FMN-binding protein [Clostridiales bacterium]